MKTVLAYLCVFSLLLLCPLALAQSTRVTIIRYPSGMTDDDPRANYDKALLTLILDKTVNKYGPYKLVGSMRMHQVRAIASLKTGEIDLMPTVYSAERDKDLLAIKHDIHRSLMGIRLLLIPRAKLPLFANITNVEDLKKLSAGQGLDWPDSNILKDNGFKLVTSQTYAGLFKMLETDRFDYFPRAITEIWDELKIHESEDLVVEPNLALVYYSPAYIFVNKSNKALAKRLNEGFEIANRDGSFNKLFLEKNTVNLALSNLKGRRIFYLENTWLPLSIRATRPNLNF
jgi:hypothetical protein